MKFWQVGVILDNCHDWAENDSSHLKIKNYKLVTKSYCSVEQIN